MFFNFFKKKKSIEAVEYEGRFISDDEIKEMVRPSGDGMFSQELKEIKDELERIRNYGK